MALDRHRGRKLAWAGRRWLVKWSLEATDDIDALLIIETKSLLSPHPTKLNVEHNLKNNTIAKPDKIHFLEILNKTCGGWPPDLPTKPEEFRWL